MAVNLTLEQVKELLKKANQVIVDEKRSGNNLGIVLKLANGCIINCWDKGTVEPLCNQIRKEQSPNEKAEEDIPFSAFVIISGNYAIQFLPHCALRHSSPAPNEAGLWLSGFL